MLLNCLCYRIYRIILATNLLNPKEFFKDLHEDLYKDLHEDLYKNLYKDLYEDLYKDLYKDLHKDLYDCFIVDINRTLCRILIPY